MTLRLLGPFQITDASGREIPIPNRKARALLAYLAFHPDRPQSREHLATLLWGDHSELHARQSLRQCLARLRRSVGSVEEDAIVATPEDVLLRGVATDTDIRRVETLSAAGGAEALAQAAAMLEPELLSGLAISTAGFEEWLEAERAKLSELRRELLVRLAESLADEGHHKDAVDAARHALELDPLSEPLHRLLMRMHLAAGDRSAALRQYKTCEMLLRRELDVAPGEVTRALEEMIRSGAGGHDAIESSRETTSPPPLAEIPFANRPAVAVLPFEYNGENSDQSYIADGITEDLTTLLSYWRWLPVIAVNSARRVARDHSSAPEAGRELGANYVVVGSVRGAGERLRITSELIDVNSGRQLWTRRFDQDRGDLFEVQDEIAGAIAKNIEPELERAEQRRAMRKPPRDVGAWECAVRASALLMDMTREHIAEARQWAEKAAELDPSFSHAYSLLASSYWTEAIFGWTNDPDAAFDACEASARRAVIVDDADWMAHAYLGISSLWNRRMHDAAIAEFERALELNPSAAQAHHGFACALEFSGRPEEALPHLETVVRLDPSYRNRPALLGDFALSHLLLGNYESALGFARQSVAAMPDYTRGMHRLAAILGHLAKFDEARTVRDEVMRLQPDFSEAYIKSTYPFKEQRDLERLLSGLHKAGLV